MRVMINIIIPLLLLLILNVRSNITWINTKAFEKSIEKKFSGNDENDR